MPAAADAAPITVVAIWYTPKPEACAAMSFAHTPSSGLRRDLFSRDVLPGAFSNPDTSSSISQAQVMTQPQEADTGNIEPTQAKDIGTPSSITRIACDSETDASLKNRDYAISDDHITLKDGVLVEKSEDVAEAGLVTDKEGTPLSACGQLPGDDATVQIVALYTSGGGSATDTFLIPLLETGGGTEEGVPLRIGDQVQLTNIAISNREVIVNYLGHGPNDPLCCSTVAKSIKLNVIGKALVCSDEACRSTLAQD